MVGRRFIAGLEFGHFEDDFQAFARMVLTGPQDLSSGRRERFARCRYLPGKGAAEAGGALVLRPG